MNFETVIFSFGAPYQALIRVEGGDRPLDMIDKIDLRTPRLSNLIYFKKFKTVLTLISQNLGKGRRFEVDVSNRKNGRKLSEIRDFCLLYFLSICLFFILILHQIS